MALKATVFRADLQISDMDRNYYENHSLTIARHPSETDQRMMLRILVFALHAGPELSFTRGLSTDDEPDLWRKSLSDEIELWIDLGQVDEKRIRKACGRARQVIVYTYRGHGSEIWWDQVGGKLDRFDNLSVIDFPEDACRALGAMAERSMQLQCTIQDGQAWISDGTNTAQLDPVIRKRPA